jgi:hypothetical protein
VLLLVKRGIAFFITQVNAYHLGAMVVIMAPGRLVAWLVESTACSRATSVSKR